MYLVQGRSDLVLDFLEIVGTLSRILIATWDKPITSEQVEVDNTFFIPKTTWADGRNFLLSKALKKYPDAKYFIFSDDDVRFNNQFLEKFENYLSHLTPDIAVPLCDRIRREGAFSKNEIEHPFFHDANFQAFHRNVIDEGVLFPIDTTFDEISWWLTCEIQLYLIQTHYLSRILRFNRLEVLNSNHIQPSTQADAGSFTSSYVNKPYTNVQRINVQKYLRMKYGHVKPILGTLMQPVIYSYLYINVLQLCHIKRLLHEIRSGNVKRVIKLSIVILSTLLLKTFYQLFLPHLTLRGHYLSSIKKSRPNSL